MVGEQNPIGNPSRTWSGNPSETNWQSETFPSETRRKPIGKTRKPVGNPSETVAGALESRPFEVPPSETRRKHLEGQSKQGSAWFRSTEFSHTQAIQPSMLNLTPVNKQAGWQIKCGMQSLRECTNRSIVFVPTASGSWLATRCARDISIQQQTTTKLRPQNVPETRCPLPILSHESHCVSATRAYSFALE